MLRYEDVIGMANGKGFSDEQLAGIALLLSEYRAEIDSHIEVLKKILRASALEIKGEEDTVRISAIVPGTKEDIGEIWVTFPQARLKLRKGADPTTTKDWETWVEQRSTYVIKKGAQVPPDSSVVELSEGTPRVSFKKKEKK